MQLYPSTTLVEYKYHTDYEYILLEDVIELDLWMYPYIKKLNNMNQRVSFIVGNKTLELQLISLVTNQFSKEMETLQQWKEEANTLFKQNDFINAKRKYLQCLELALLISSVQHELVCSLFLNLAACYLKLNKYKLCIEACNRVLKNEPNNIKALYRRGMAFEKDEQKELAMQDFSKAIAWIKQNQKNLDMLAALEQAVKKASF